MAEPAKKEQIDDDLDAEQVSQIVAMAKFDGRNLKPPESQVKKEEVIPEPKVEESAQLPRDREPEPKVEEEIEPPVEEKAPVEEPEAKAEPTAENIEMERLQKQNEALMKLLNEQAGGGRSFVPREDVSLTSQKAPTTPAPKPGEPIKFVDAERFHKVFESPEELNVLLNEVYQKGQASAPAPVDTTSMSDIAKMEYATAKYFDENPDLESVRQYVAGQIPRLLEAADAPKTFKELLVKAGDETRVLLHMPVPKQVSETDGQPSKGNQKIGGSPAFAPAPSGPRGGPGQPKKPQELTPEQKQIKELMEFKERL